MALIKFLIILLVPALLVLPFLPFKWIFSFSYYTHPNVSRRRNLINIAALAALALLCTALVPTLRNVVIWFANLKLINSLLSRIPVYASYSDTLAVTITVNILYCLLAFAVLQIIQGSGSISDRMHGLKETVRKEKRRPRKKTDKDKDKGKATPDVQTEDELPPELLPEPEEPPEDNRIILPGVTVEKKKRVSKKAAAVAENADDGGSDTAGLADRLREIFCESVDKVLFVRPQTRHTAKHLKSFLIVVGVMYTAVFILLLIPMLYRTRVLEDQIYGLLQFFITVNYLYPVLALPVLLLIFRLMNGETAPIAPTEPGTDPSPAQKGRVVDLDRVEAGIMKLCGKSFEVRSFFSGDVAGGGADRTTVDLDENDLLRSVAEYVQSEGLELNQEYLIGIKGFIEGQNVLFHAPLYTAVSAYIYAVLNLRIMQGERVLVICHNRSQIPNCIDQMNQGFMGLTRTHRPLWRIIPREEFSKNSNVDVLVLTPEDFRDNELFAAAEVFLRNVTAVLMPDANQLVSANNYACQVISQRLSRCCRKGMQYIFLSSRTVLNLDNALTEYFMLDRKPVYARGDYSYGDVHIYVWRAKGERTEVIDNAGRSMSLEVSISDVAFRFGITEPNLISDSAIYSNQINPHWLDIYDASKRPLGFAIVADDSFNLPGVIYAYSRYIGKKASVLHVISRQYLLRNYFYDRAPRYLFEQPLLESSMLEHAKKDRSRMILLLCRLTEGIPVEDFVLELGRMGCGLTADPGDFESISRLVDDFLELVTGSRPDNGREHFTLEQEKGVFYPRRILRIAEDYGALAHLMEETELVRLRFTSGARGTVSVNLFRTMLDQRYLRGQNLVYANQNYVIKRINRAEGIIEIDDADSVHGLAKDYVQLRSYSLLTPGLIDICTGKAQDEKLEKPLSRMRREYLGGDDIARALVMVRPDAPYKIGSDTLGYYMIHTDSRLLSIENSRISLIRLTEGERRELHREVSGGLYLRLEMDRERDDRLTMTVAALLQEMMKTLFPDRYFCLSVCPILESPDEIYENGDPSSKAIAQLYPRLESWGKVYPDSIELFIVDDCVGGTGAMELLFEQEGTFVQNILWMLSDYLEWQKDNEPSPYIFFGTETQPAIFDLDSTRRVLRSFAHSYVREHDVHSEIGAVNRCAICGRVIDDPYLWHGRFNICSGCSEEYAPTPEEAEKILGYAVKYLKDSFGVSLPELQLSVQEELHGDALSALDFTQKTLILLSELPLRAVHTQIMLQLVRYWQLENLNIDGDPLVDGQPLYVSLQYLNYLEQYRYARFLHREYLLGKDDASRGYCSLTQALQESGHDNSFLYLLGYRKKGGTPPIKRSVKKDSSRVTQNGNVPYYFRSRLSDAEGLAYDTILAGYKAFDAEIDMSACLLPKKDIFRIHQCVFDEHPEVFWTNGGRGFVYYSDNSGNVTRIVPNYVMTKEESERRQAEIDAETAPFISELTDDMEDYAVALKVYEKIIEYLDYDTLASERQKRMSDEQKKGVPDELRNIHGAIVQHKSVCTGYARAYQYLLQKAGIETVCVHGTCNSGGRHSWNIVRLEGEYYHTDATWGDGSDTDPSKNRESLSHAYFAVTDELMKRSRSADEDLPLPACHSDGCNYFVRNGLHFTRLDADAVREALTEGLRDPKNYPVELRFENARLLRNAEQYVRQNGIVSAAARAAGRGNVSCSTYADEESLVLKIYVK